MSPQGDMKPPQSIKAEFDQNLNVTSAGGAVLVERAVRRLGFRRAVSEHLGERSEAARVSMNDAVMSLLAGFWMGARGIEASDCLKEDRLLARIFGIEGAAPSAATSYRLLCELSGLPQRRFDEVYESAGPQLVRNDMFGQEKSPPRHKRTVPEEPECASPESLMRLERFNDGVARRCLMALGQKVTRIHGWYPMFCDATDLQVSGRCFDAARTNHHKERVLRWQTVCLGPVFLKQSLTPGNVDEGRSMPALLSSTRDLVRETLGSKAPILALLDGAYFERPVIEPLRAWTHFIVGANQQRDCLERLARERFPDVWRETGPDAVRGWRRSQVCCFTHQPEGWTQPVTIVARRWENENELQGMWRYSFVATNIEERDLPKKLLRRHGYCEAIWLLYGTKQGHENHYKTALCDFGLHHPPSGRLGVNQALYALVIAAVNVAQVLRYRVVKDDKPGMAFWRFRQRYLQIAGRLVRSARTLTVFLAGGDVGAERQVLWKRAFAAAGRL